MLPGRTTGTFVNVERATFELLDRLQQRFHPLLPLLQAYGNWYADEEVRLSPRLQSALGEWVEGGTVYTMYRIPYVAAWPDTQSYHDLAQGKDHAEESGAGGSDPV